MHRRPASPCGGVSGGCSLQRDWLGAAPAMWPQAPAAHPASGLSPMGAEKGRPPARRGRAGGFHWCPGHRGCRVTALVSASRRNTVPTNCLLACEYRSSEGEISIASCDVRADFALDHPKASPIRRRGFPCHGVRYVVAAGLFPLPACTTLTQQAVCQRQEMAERRGLPGACGQLPLVAACCHRYMKAAATALRWPVSPAVVRFLGSCNTYVTGHSRS